MAGLRKAKKYDWKDSNLALFGSDTEKQVKKSSAEMEPAWKGAGQDVGLKVWRIVKFKVTEWPKEDYGKFFDGDSYIILNTYKEEGGDELLHDVHFWIGKYSTQDEYGTAAYKTVELDTFLDDKPVQHREIQNYESEMFKSYFKTISYLRGGADSGFNKVKPEEYRTRLLHFSGQGRNVTVTEVPVSKNRVNSGDVFILDKGLDIIQWNGSGSSKDERFKALQFVNKLKSERNGRPKQEVVEEGSGDQEFMDSLTEEDDEDDTPTGDDNFEKILFKLSDASGTMEFSKIAEGVTDKGMLDSSDVFILHTPKMLFVWVGNGTSVGEKRNALAYAHKYLSSTSNPILSVTCVKEGRKQHDFDMAIAA